VSRAVVSTEIVDIMKAFTPNHVATSRSRRASPSVSRRHHSAFVPPGCGQRSLASVASEGYQFAWASRRPRSHRENLEYSSGSGNLNRSHSNRTS
jgi:hypothetical protein